MSSLDSSLNSSLDSSSSSSLDSSSPTSTSISVIAAADANYASLDEKDDQYTFRYEPRDISDVQVDVPMVDREGKPTGVVYHFHLHRAILSSKCLWFRTDPTCTHLTMPTTFVYHHFGNEYYVLAGLQQIQHLFNTVYMVPGRHWWCLSVDARSSLICPDEGPFFVNSYGMIQLCFYVDYAEVLGEIQSHLTLFHVDDRMYHVFTLVIAHHYKIKTWENEIFNRIKNKQDMYITMTKDLIREGTNTAYPLLNSNQWRQLMVAVIDK